MLVYKINNGSEVLKGSPGLVKVPDDLWVYYIDQDSDGSFNDEKPMFDYKYRFDTFNFYQGEAEVRPLMTFSANVGEGPQTYREYMRRFARLALCRDGGRLQYLRRRQK